MSEYSKRFEKKTDEQEEFDKLYQRCEELAKENDNLRAYYQTLEHRNSDTHIATVNTEAKLAEILAYNEKLQESMAAIELENTELEDLLEKVRRAMRKMVFTMLMPGESLETNEEYLNAVKEYQEILKHTENPFIDPLTPVERGRIIAAKLVDLVGLLKDTKILDDPNMMEGLELFNFDDEDSD